MSQTAALGDRSIEKHVSIIGALQIAFGALGLFIGMIAFVVLAGSGFISGDQDAAMIMSVIATFVVALFAALSLPLIVAGVGLIKRKRWARMLTMILGVLNLLNFPFGTALGIYALWAMMQPEAEALLSR
jgi:hypothetical protein